MAENRGGGSPGQGTYENLCASCHGDHREGSPPAFPSLVGVAQCLSDRDIAAVIHSGRGRMPSFPMVDDATMSALLQYLKSSEAVSNKGPEEAGRQEMTSATATGYRADTSDPVGAKSYAEHCAICHGASDVH